MDKPLQQQLQVFSYLFSSASPPPPPTHTHARSQAHHTAPQQEQRQWQRQQRQQQQRQQQQQSLLPKAEGNCCTRRPLTVRGCNFAPSVPGSALQVFGMGALGTVDLTRTELLSEATKAQVDHEVQALLTNAYNGARKTLTMHMGQVHTLAGELLKEETLTVEQVRRVLDIPQPARQS